MAGKPNYNELKQKIKELEQEVAEARSNEEKNIALKVLLSQRDNDKKKLEKSIMANVTELIMPNLIRLKNSKLSGKQHFTLCGQSFLKLHEAYTNRNSSGKLYQARNIFKRYS